MSKSALNSSSSSNIAMLDRRSVSTTFSHSKYINTKRKDAFSPSPVVFMPPSCNYHCSQCVLCLLIHAFQTRYFRRKNSHRKRVTAVINHIACAKMTGLHIPSLEFWTLLEKRPDCIFISVRDANWIAAQYCSF